MHDFNHDGKNDYKDYIMYDKYISSNNKKSTPSRKNSNFTPLSWPLTILTIFVTLLVMGGFKIWAESLPSPWDTIVIISAPILLIVSIMVFAIIASGAKTDDDNK